MEAVDITDSDHIKEKLIYLNADTLPLWGNMAAQQMIEHLIEQVQYTNGVKVPVDTGLPADYAERKQRWVYTDELIPRNLVLGQLPDKLTYTGLETARQQLLAELETFHAYYRANPGIMVLHGGFGMMDYHEWVLWHNKHFTHHFKQFGLTQ
ncbi:hypothetical protein CKK33_09645 [Mucilaginibacter sp. MD40]|uniref:hypothetical protein n=1 Tax=Mucilaginibacter sp. MD40 TaxID=2029590 RepID=UPI000BAC929B|nr:hypothetical protein [Mucilaginibacter sp. MD40]PAW93741.1 hypothetical protein CKK33_09645 [Mucilaginibacter sp. MD40]